MEHHKVRTHKWYNGILQFKDHIFGSKEEAVEFANCEFGPVVPI